MPTRRLNGQTYDEYAIVAAYPLPVDIGGGSITISGNVVVSDVTVSNTAANPVPVSDAGGLLSVDDGGSSLSIDDGGATISIDDGGGSITVDGPLTDAQLRATAVPVSGPLTDTQLRASAVPVSGPLTDTQLRASAVPVVGTVAARTPTTASVVSTTSSVLLLAANANRKGLMVSNQSTSKLYLSFTSPATQANSFMQMDPGGFLLLDQQMIFSSDIYGVWTNANGAAQVTQFA